MYSVIEFDEDSGALAIVNTKWLTPRKKEVYWPPITDINKFKKCLRSSFDPSNIEKWKLYPIIWRLPIENLAERKIYPMTIPQVNSKKKRKPFRFLDSESDDSDSPPPPARFKRPSPISDDNTLVSHLTPTISEIHNLHGSTPETSNTIILSNNVERSDNLCTKNGNVYEFRYSFFSPINYIRSSKNCLILLLEDWVKMIQTTY
ncbi:hypothetical protein FQR65_LT18177 [Abscondita terminalis]|nr:hypothetical protein FQR65_LT18177 [Abscondita terminalis]